MCNKGRTIIAVFAFVVRVLVSSRFSERKYFNLLDLMINMFHGILRLCFNMPEFRLCWYEVHSAAV